MWSGLKDEEHVLGGARRDEMDDSNDIPGGVDNATTRHDGCATNSGHDNGVVLWNKTHSNLRPVRWPDLAL